MRNEFQEMLPGPARKRKSRGSNGPILVVGIFVFLAAIAVAVFVSARLTSSDLPQKEANAAVSPSPKNKIDAGKDAAKQPITKAAPSENSKKEPNEQKSPFADLPPLPPDPERLPQLDERLPQLDAWQIEKGKSYLTDGGRRAEGFYGNTWARVQQIIDDDNMLIDITSDKDKGWVLVWAKFSTKKLSDGKFDFLANIIGTDKITVTGRKQYTSALGATKTVFVIEASK